MKSRLWFSPLSFPDIRDEAAFRAKFVARSVSAVALGIGIATVIWASWVSVDFLLPDDQRNNMLLIRFGLVTPLLLLGLFGMLTARLQGYFQLWVQIAFLALCLGVGAVANLYDINRVAIGVFGVDTGIAENSVMYIFIMVFLYILFSCTALMPILFESIVLFSLTFLATCFYTYFLLDPPLPIASIGFLLSTLGVFMAISAIYQRESAARENFMAQRTIQYERDRSEDLLLNILPTQIADRLKADRATIADAFDNVSILFADIVGFTPLAANTTPAKLVDILNAIFTDFDRIVQKYGAEKIKTIGDAYMIASGIPEHRADHSKVIAECALDMAKAMQTYSSKSDLPIQIRIGIHSGAVIAGVIGAHKFAYDLWGDTVNVASRLESSGKASRIQASESIYEALKDDFIFEFRGDVELKGKGAMKTWWLIGRKGETQGYE